MNQVKDTETRLVVLRAKDGNLLLTFAYDLTVSYEADYQRQSLTIPGYPGIFSISFDNSDGFTVLQEGGLVGETDLCGWDITLSAAGHVFVETDNGMKSQKLEIVSDCRVIEIVIDDGVITATDVLPRDIGRYFVEEA